MLPLELALGFGIGLSLGLLGGGGSLLTVPALVYLVGQTPQAAMTTSLAIVGTNSLMGALMHRAQGTLDWKVALIFGGTGMLASYFAVSISSQLSPEVLLITFALLMLIIGSMLFFRKNSETEADSSTKPLWLVLASGAGVGLLTGVFGVGGGFLIVPALVMLVGLPIQMAVGTSLVVIAMNSFAGFLGHMGRGSIDLILTLIFASAGLAGTFAGTKLSVKFSSSKLQKAFAGFVIALGFFLLYDNLPKFF
ncbi:MAG TPA: sulfite exporter TauE/SafE family protein [Anaerolineales bacterium]|nr:sulfite exporter TauE/SafE family protein [Anaerolineales bacterium]